MKHEIVVGEGKGKEQAVAFRLIDLGSLQFPPESAASCFARLLTTSLNVPHRVKHVLE